MDARKHPRRPLARGFSDSESLVSKHGEISSFTHSRPSTTILDSYKCGTGLEANQPANHVQPCSYTEVSAMTMQEFWQLTNEVRALKVLLLKMRRLLLDKLDASDADILRTFGTRFSRGTLTQLGAYRIVPQLDGTQKVTVQGSICEDINPSQSMGFPPITDASHPKDERLTTAPLELEAALEKNCHECRRRSEHRNSGQDNAPAQESERSSVQRFEADPSTLINELYCKIDELKRVAEEQEKELDGKSFAISKLQRELERLRNIELDLREQQGAMETELRELKDELQRYRPRF